MGGLDRALRLFSREYGGRPEAVFSAPGRTELGGNHTDHERGRVLAAAVTARMYAAARANDAGVLRVSSEGMEPFEVGLGDLRARISERGRSAALVRGVAAGLSSAGIEPRGADIAVASEVPIGGGLSSSACFEVLTAAAIASLSGAAPGAASLAGIGREAENRYFGKPCGLMDQLACALGGTVFIDFAGGEPAVERLRFDPGAYGYALCLVGCGAGHEDLTEEYAAITREMRSVAACLGGEVLGETDEEEFYSRIYELRGLCGGRAVLRSVHFYGENRRAALEAQAIRRGDMEGFLALARESGRSSAVYLQNLAVPGGDQSLPIALSLCERALAGRGAARVHGGGFGGAVQCFVPLGGLDAFMRAVSPLEARVLGIDPDGVRMEM